MVQRKKSAKKRSTKAKKTASRRRPSAQKAGAAGRLARLCLRWGWRLALFALGAAIGLLGPAYWVLKDDVVARFAGRRVDQPSRVYARALELYPGQLINEAELRSELAFANYRDGSVTQPGRFRVSAQGLHIHTRPFHYADGAEAARRLLITLEQGRISQIRDQIAKTNLSLARIDPAEIASIYPLSGEDRSATALPAFPPLLVTAIQAVEDRSFKHHHGVDVRGLLRAVWINLRHGGLRQGGSTITQQLVKNLYLSPARTFWRKFNESLMAIAIERHFDKGAILEAYLNEVNLGQDGAHPVHGFSRAADFYFGVPVSSLNAPQIALLVGMVKGPSWYNPRKQPERAMQRRNQVLQVMFETGLLNQARYERARKSPLGIQRQSQRRRSGRFPAFIDLVRRQLRRDYRDRDLTQAGLRILTTLHPVAQQGAEAAVEKGLADSGDGQLQGAMVVIAPHTGEVAAMVGDRSPRRLGYNRALDASRQIGSVMKPLVYLLALEQGYSLSTPLSDQPISVSLQDGSQWRPSNYDGRSHGQIPLLSALAESYNQATVRVGMEVGVTKVLELLSRLGVQNDVRPHPSALLGAVELSPFQVAQAYQALAADGFYTPLSSVQAVLDAKGRPLARYPTRKQALPERRGVALINYALSRTSTEGTARRLPQLLGRELRVAAKTGTTNDRRDAWFVGYTADWLGVVWVGRDDNRPAGITGAATAMPVWARLFRYLSSQDLHYTVPDDVAWYWIDWPRHELADESCENARAVPYIKGSEPDVWSSCIGGVKSFLRNF